MLLFLVGFSKYDYRPIRSANGKLSDSDNRTGTIHSIKPCAMP